MLAGNAVAESWDAIRHLQVLPGQALPLGIREQLNGPIILPSMYLRRATKAFQVITHSILTARCCCIAPCNHHIHCTDVAAEELRPGVIMQKPAESLSRT